jgi:hypothetical protein
MRYTRTGTRRMRNNDRRFGVVHKRFAELRVGEDEATAIGSPTARAESP